MRQDRHPQGRNCQDLALLIIVFFPVAVPALAARTWWLRRKARLAREHDRLMNERARLILDGVDPEVLSIALPPRWWP